MGELKADSSVKLINNAHLKYLYIQFIIDPGFENGLPTLQPRWLKGEYVDIDTVVLMLRGRGERTKFRGEYFSQNNCIGILYKIAYDESVVL